ncbi:MAG: antibiotic biosynthesis monooxygenase [Rhodocyclaceae bacterium]|nr:antibiotic biosynthesis monooxygenase [Rhodocyclaceae bacterium]
MNPAAFARTPAPPYYAVIFSSSRTPGDQGYAAMARKMAELAARQPGFLGMESARDADGGGFGITVSYWASTAAITAWKADVEHMAAQQMGKQVWYEHYALRVARVERAYAKSST